MASYPAIISLLIFCGGGMSFLYAGIVSIIEKEKRATLLFFAFSFLFLLISCLILLFSGSFSGPLGYLIGIVFILILILFGFPISGLKNTHIIYPDKRFDERDIQFARHRLRPDTPNFNAYYNDNPENKKIDDHQRSMPGLLSPKAKKYHLASFYASEANFETVGLLRPYAVGNIDEDRKELNPAQISKFLKSWLKKQGAHSVGLCELKDYHIYKRSGKTFDYGKDIDLNHKYVIVFTVEMDKEMIDFAPEGPTVMESSHIYLTSGVMAVNVASFIRNLGHSARAHIDGNYEIICPLVARDAGLGEIGRMGILMTPKLGPRVRIAAITTDLPLEVSNDVQSTEMVDFCRLCKKCAKNCPTQAIPHGDRDEESGSLRWKINSDACFSFWCNNGTDCAQCIKVCPYSHPNNALHNLIRWGIKNNYLFRSLTIHLDDFFYGSKAAARPMPEWLEVGN